MIGLTKAVFAGGVLACSLLWSGVSAQPYPVKPVRIVVGFAPGGATDLLGRVLAQNLSDIWKQSVVVENRGGAAGTIGADVVAKASADGHTLLVSPQSSIAIAPAMYPD